MKQTVLASALFASVVVAFPCVSFGHGGTYRGPGDTVPSGGGPSSGGGPTTPGSGGPSTPTPSGPTTPSPGTPTGPGGVPGAPKAPTTGGGDQGPDLTSWQFWWGFNREPYLNLKSHVHAEGVVTGSDIYWLGQGTKAQAKDTYRPSEDTIRNEVVPALLGALKSEKDKDIVTGCLVALSKIGPGKDEAGNSAVLTEIKKWLADGNQEIAETAAVCLGILADDSEENIAILTLLLEDDGDALRAKPYEVRILGSVPNRTRAFAAYGLGLIGHRSSKDEVRLRIVRTLAKMADGPARAMATRDVAVACLISLGLVPIRMEESEIYAHVSSDGFTKPQGGILTRVDQIRWLMGHYDDPQVPFLVRAHVPRSVAMLVTATDMRANDVLKEGIARKFLADIDGRSRTARQTELELSCILALGRLGDCDEDDIDAEIRKGLMKVREDASEAMPKNFAMIALGQVCGRPGTRGDPLAGLDKDKEVKKFFLTQLTKGQASFRAWSALAIGVLERSLADAKRPTNGDLRSAVRESLAEAKSPLEVGAYAISAGIMGDVEATDALRRKLAQIDEDDARGYVAIGIGLIGDTGAKEDIHAILRKSQYKPDLLKSAAIGLGLLGDKDTVPDLIRMLGEANALSSQAAISSALGFIGDARSIEPLIKLLQDAQKTPRARGFAAVALGIVADKETLPWNTKISVDINYLANTSTLTSGEGTGILDIL